MARKPTTFNDKPKKDYHKPKEVELVDGTKVVEQYHNQYMVKNVFPKEKPDIEKTKAPKDKASKHKYPPPKKHPVFRSKWMVFIDSVTSRSNFKQAHLEALEVLCDLYAEYADLQAYIRVNGRTYKTVSRFGESRKLHPEVGQLEKVKGNINRFTRQLDLFPKKDHSTESGGEGEDWE